MPESTAKQARFPTRAQLELHQELHARPPLPARSNCVVSYWVLIDLPPARADAVLATLCLSCGSQAPSPGTRHHVLHGAGLAVKFERHGEFVSFQVIRPLPELPAALDDATLAELIDRSSALAGLPDAFVEQLAAPGAGSLLAATHVVMVDARHDDSLLGRCQTAFARRSVRAPGDDAHTLMGAFIGDSRRGAVLTHLQLAADGFTRFVVLDFGMSSHQSAREVQRLCEIEAYRMLAMRGFPVAQAEGSRLGELEGALQQTVDAMANDDAHDDAQAFESLTRLAAEVEHSAARTRYRFSATRAYHRIVERRLNDLREQRIAGVQTLSGFLTLRFAPAMAFCETMDQRLTDVAERINRATALARVRIEVRREEGNQQLLRALAQRQQQQLQLQQTVEGLSVLAISYYALGLVGYLAKAAKAWSWLEPLHIQPDIVVGVALIPVFLAVTAFVRNLQKNHGASETPHD